MSDLEPPEGEGYDLQRVYAEKLKPFWFRWDDRWWKLPHLRMLDFEVQAQVESFDFGALTDSKDIEATKTRVNDLFTLLMGGELGAQWRTTVRPLTMLLDMVNRWVEHSGGTPGEAQASPDSSKSTGRPSKRTSTASTGSGSRRPSRAKKAAPAAAATPPGSS
jgi:hypothetical protein